MKHHKHCQHTNSRNIKIVVGSWRTYFSFAGEIAMTSNEETMLLLTLAKSCLYVEPPHLDRR
jgi:hypothetical protein